MVLISERVWAGAGQGGWSREDVGCRRTKNPHDSEERERSRPPRPLPVSPCTVLVTLVRISLRFCIPMRLEATFATLNATTETLTNTECMFKRWINKQQIRRPLSPGNDPVHTDGENEIHIKPDLSLQHKHLSSKSWSYLVSDPLL